VRSRQRSFYKITGGSKCIKSLINQFLKLNDDRNRVVHGMWRPDLEGGTVRYVSRRNLTIKRFKYQAAELEEKANNAKALIIKLLHALEDGRPK